MNPIGTKSPEVLRRQKGRTQTENTLEDRERTRTVSTSWEEHAGIRPLKPGGKGFPTGPDLEPIMRTMKITFCGLKPPIFVIMCAARKALHESSSPSHPRPLRLLLRLLKPCSRLFVHQGDLFSPQSQLLWTSLCFQVDKALLQTDEKRIIISYSNDLENGEENLK